MKEPHRLFKLIVADVGDHHCGKVGVSEGLLNESYLACKPPGIGSSLPDALTAPSQDRIQLRPHLMRPGCYHVHGQVLSMCVPLWLLPSILLPFHKKFSIFVIVAFFLVAEKIILGCALTRREEPAHARR